MSRKPKPNAPFPAGRVRRPLDSNFKWLVLVTLDDRSGSEAVVSNRLLTAAVSTGGCNTL
jgi:hypothetical protein